MEDFEEPAAAERGEAVAARGVAGAAVHDVDVVPAHELRLERGVDDGVGVLDAAERLVGEDDAEAEGVVGGVALPDRDVAARVEPLEEGGGVQAAGSAADDRHSQGSHGHRPCHLGARFSVKAAWNSA